MASIYRCGPSGASIGRGSEPPRLLDRLRFALRTKHYGRVALSSRSTAPWVTPPTNDYPSESDRRRRSACIAWFCTVCRLQVEVFVYPDE
jgi:hypothetical protein